MATAETDTRIESISVEKTSFTLVMDLEEAQRVVACLGYFAGGCWSAYDQLYNAVKAVDEDPNAFLPTQEGNFPPTLVGVYDE